MSIASISGPRPRRLLLAAFCAALTAAPALAQTASPTRAGDTLPADDAASLPAAAKRDGDGAKQLDLVLISATRRREPMREVPMQVNVMQAEALQEGGAKNLADYLSAQPGVDLNSLGAPGIGGISMRGVSTGQQATATVGVYIDEVAAGSSGGWANGGITSLDMALLDLNHIEILRGPQGTLYGAGAMGGLLKYVTNEPDTYELSGKLALGASTTRSGRAGSTVSGVVNVPLKEDMAGLRVAAFSDQVGGYVDAVGLAAGEDINRGSTRGARASLLLTPVRGLKLRLTALQQTLEREGRDLVAHDSQSMLPVEGQLTRRLYVAEQVVPRLSLNSADLEYDLNWGRVNLIASHQISRASSGVDTSQQYLPTLAQFGLPATAVDFVDKTEQTKDTLEVRLTSKSDKRFEWLAGLFHARELVSRQQQGSAFMGGGVPPLQLLTTELPNSYRETAAYGDATWKFDSGLALTAGLRTARNSQTVTQESSGLLLGGAVTRTGASADSSQTYLLTAGYALEPHSSVYARFATGYRPGGPNTVLLDANGKQVTPDFYGPDTLVSYELGYKADWLQRRLSVELAAYDVEWSDVQQLSSIGGISFFVNGGAARVRGVEFSANYRAAEHWALSASGSFINGRLLEDWAGLNGKAGDRMPGSARAAFSLSLRHEFSVAGKPAYAALAQRYVGDRRAGFAGSLLAPDYMLPAYALTDLQGGIDCGALNLAFYLRNLFDARPQLGTYPGGAQGQTLVSVGQPRTFGMTATFAF